MSRQTFDWLEEMRANAERGPLAHVVIMRDGRSAGYHFVERGPFPIAGVDGRPLCFEPGQRFRRQRSTGPALTRGIELFLGMISPSRSRLGFPCLSPQFFMR